MTRATCECCGEPLALLPVQPATLIEAREWNGHPIHRRQVDGYVNATAMCKANGRHFPHYLANGRTSEYLQDLSGSVGIPTDLLRVTIGNGPNHLRGTWVHPRLAVDLARWISPAFAVWMDGWFLEQFQPPASPTTTNHRQLTASYRGFLGNSPRIVIHAASDAEAAALWEQAVANTVLDGLIHHRRRSLHRGGSPRYEVALTR
jgi:KilA-N domain